MLRQTPYHIPNEGSGPTLYATRANERSLTHTHASLTITATTRRLIRASLFLSFCPDQASRLRRRHLFEKVGYRAESLAFVRPSVGKGKQSEKRNVDFTGESDSKRDSEGEAESKVEKKRQKKERKKEEGRQVRD